MQFHVLDANFAKQLIVALQNSVFTCTVQFTCTVHANSASELHYSREQCNSLALFEFFFSVCLVFVFKKKTSLE